MADKIFAHQFLHPLFDLMTKPVVQRSFFVLTLSDVYTLLRSLGKVQIVQTSFAFTKGDNFIHCMSELTHQVIEVSSFFSINCSGTLTKLYASPGTYSTFFSVHLLRIPSSRSISMSTVPSPCDIQCASITKCDFVI